MNEQSETYFGSNGYFFIQKAKEFERLARTDVLDWDITGGKAQQTYGAQGWIKINKAIRIGEIVKFSVDHYREKTDVSFNYLKNIPNGKNGDYEIRGGQYSGRGSFINIRPTKADDASFGARDNAKFANFFVCHSGEPYLRWRIVLQEFTKLDITDD